MAKLLTVNQTSRNNKRRFFTATFLGIPMTQDYVAAQVKAGYHPAGYGDPMDMKAVPNGDGKYTATWACFESCD